MKQGSIFNLSLITIVSIEDYNQNNANIMVTSIIPIVTIILMIIINKLNIVVQHLGNTLILLGVKWLLT